jgi:hypothetical protein
MPKDALAVFRVEQRIPAHHSPSDSPTFPFMNGLARVSAEPQARRVTRRLASSKPEFPPGPRQAFASKYAGLREEALNEWALSRPEAQQATPTQVVGVGLGRVPGPGLGWTGISVSSRACSRSGSREAAGRRGLYKPATAELMRAREQAAQEARRRIGEGSRLVGATASRALARAEGDVGARKCWSACGPARPGCTSAR